MKKRAAAEVAPPLPAWSPYTPAALARIAERIRRAKPTALGIERVLDDLSPPPHGRGPELVAHLLAHGALAPSDHVALIELFGRARQLPPAEALLALLGHVPKPRDVSPDWSELATGTPALVHWAAVAAPAELDALAAERGGALADLVALAKGRAGRSLTDAEKAGLDRCLSRAVVGCSASPQLPSVPYDDAAPFVALSPGEVLGIAERSTSVASYARALLDRLLAKPGWTPLELARPALDAASLDELGVVQRYVATPDEPAASALIAYVHARPEPPQAFLAAARALYDRAAKEAPVSLGAADLFAARAMLALGEGTPPEVDGWLALASGLDPGGLPRARYLATALRALGPSRVHAIAARLAEGWPPAQIELTLAAHPSEALEKKIAARRPLDERLLRVLASAEA
ncbi:MAG: hypothetical protein U0234_00785 [Sandaracinus sp.]